MEKKLRILVVEDGDENIKAAKAMLSEHDVTVVSSYDLARRMILGEYDHNELCEEMGKRGLPEHQNAYSKKYGINYWNDESDRRKEWEKINEEIIKTLTPLPFEVLLTDVKIPKGGYDMLSDEAIKTVDVQVPMPYGAYITFLAIEKGGIKLIGMITQGDHHEDPFVFALDGLKGFTTDKFKIIIAKYCMAEVLTSDYKTSAPGNWEKIVKMRANGQAISVKNWAKLLNDLLDKKGNV